MHFVSLSSYVFSCNLCSCFTPTVSEVCRDCPSYAAWWYQEEWAGAGGHRLQSCGAGTLISTTLGWIAMKLHTGIHVPQRVNPLDFGDFSSTAIMRLTFLRRSEISWQLSDGLPWNLLKYSWSQEDNFSWLSLTHPVILKLAYNRSNSNAIYTADNW